MFGTFFLNFIKATTVVIVNRLEWLRGEERMMRNKGKTIRVDVSGKRIKCRLIHRNIKTVWAELLPSGNLIKRHIQKHRVVFL